MSSSQWRERRESGATDCPQTQSLSGEWREWRVLPTYCVSNFSSIRKEREIPIERSTGSRATRATHASNATPPGAQGGTPMEISMSDNPNLHPIWTKHFGIEQKAMPEPPPSTVIEALTRPIAAHAATGLSPSAREETLSRAQIEAIFDDAGWVPTSPDRPAYGAPVGVKKQLSRHTWILTTVLPSDARYPVEFRTPTTQGEYK